MGVDLDSAFTIFQLYFVSVLTVCVRVVFCFVLFCFIYIIHFIYATVWYFSFVLPFSVIIGFISSIDMMQKIPNTGFCIII